jgi:hypothetical protein
MQLLHAAPLSLCALLVLETLSGTMATPTLSENGAIKAEEAERQAIALDAIRTTCGGTFSAPRPISRRGSAIFRGRSLSDASTPDEDFDTCLKHYITIAPILFRGNPNSLKRKFGRGDTRIGMFVPEAATQFEAFTKRYVTDISDRKRTIAAANTAFISLLASISEYLKDPVDPQGSSSSLPPPSIADYVPRNILPSYIGAGDEHVRALIVALWEIRATIHLAAPPRPSEIRAARLKALHPLPPRPSEIRAARLKSLHTPPSPPSEIGAARHGK